MLGVVLVAGLGLVPHALVALQTSVIDVHTVLQWDRKAQDFPSWEQDHGLDSAIRSSVVWFFQSVAGLIGRERELEYLRSFHYGSQTFSSEVDRFWLNGDLTISPREQVAFLRSMSAYTLPVDRRHVDAVKTAMTMPAGKVWNASGLHDFPLRSPSDATVRLKTGNGTVHDEHVSWAIG